MKRALLLCALLAAAGGAFASPHCDDVWLGNQHGCAYTTQADEAMVEWDGGRISERPSNVTQTPSIPVPATPAPSYAKPRPVPTPDPRGQFVRSPDGSPVNVECLQEALRLNRGWSYARECTAAMWAGGFDTLAELDANTAKVVREQQAAGAKRLAELKAKMDREAEYTRQMQAIAATYCPKPGGSKLESLLNANREADCRARQAALKQEFQK